MVSRDTENPVTTYKEACDVLTMNGGFPPRRLLTQALKWTLAEIEGLEDLVRELETRIECMGHEF